MSGMSSPSIVLFNDIVREKVQYISDVYALA